MDVFSDGEEFPFPDISSDDDSVMDYNFDSATPRTSLQTSNEVSRAFNKKGSNILNEKFSRVVNNRCVPNSFQDESENSESDLLMERLRGRVRMYKSFREYSRSFRMALLEKRRMIDLEDKAQFKKCSDLLQSKMMMSKLPSIMERLETISRHLGLKFVNGPSGFDWFLSSDMFYLEVVLGTEGEIKKVKIHRDGSAEEEDCEELMMCLSRRDFKEFTEQVQGLISMYNLPAEKQIKSEAFLSLQHLEADIISLSEKSRFRHDPFEMIFKSHFGLVEKHSGGHPMKLLYFISPYEVPEKDEQPLSFKNLPKSTCVLSITLESSSSSYDLQKSSLINIVECYDVDNEPPLFLEIMPSNSTLLPACFSMKLNEPMPICEEFIKNIISITGIEVNTFGEIKQLLSLIETQITEKYIDYTNNSTIVILPDQQHLYVLKENQEMQGYLVRSIPFTHPEHIKQIVPILRQQALFNTLISSCIKTGTEQAIDKTYELSEDELFENIGETGDFITLEPDCKNINPESNNAKLDFINLKLGCNNVKQGCNNSKQGCSNSEGVSNNSEQGCDNSEQDCDNSIQDCNNSERVYNTRKGGCNNTEMDCNDSESEFELFDLDINSLELGGNNFESDFNNIELDDSDSESDHKYTDYNFFKMDHKRTRNNVTHDHIQYKKKKLDHTQGSDAGGISFGYDELLKGGLFPDEYFERSNDNDKYNVTSYNDMKDLLNTRSSSNNKFSRSCSVESPEFPEQMTFEIFALSCHHISISFEHPVEEGFITVELELSDIPEIRCKVETAADDVDSCLLNTEKCTTLAFKRTFSIPVAMRALLCTWEVPNRKEDREEKEEHEIEHINEISANTNIMSFIDKKDMLRREEEDDDDDYNIRNFGSPEFNENIVIKVEKIDTTLDDFPQVQGGTEFVTNPCHEFTTTNQYAEFTNQYSEFGTEPLDFVGPDDVDFTSGEYNAIAQFNQYVLFDDFPTASPYLPNSVFTRDSTNPDLSQSNVKNNDHVFVEPFPHLDNLFGVKSSFENLSIKASSGDSSDSIRNISSPASDMKTKGSVINIKDTTIENELVSAMSDCDDLNFDVCLDNYTDVDNLDCVDNFLTMPTELPGCAPSPSREDDDDCIIMETDSVLGFNIENKSTPSANIIPISLSSFQNSNDLTFERHSSIEFMPPATTPELSTPSPLKMAPVLKKEPEKGRDKSERKCKNKQSETKHVERRKKRKHDGTLVDPPQKNQLKSDSLPSSVPGNIKQTESSSHPLSPTVSLRKFNISPTRGISTVIGKLSPGGNNNNNNGKLSNVCQVTGMSSPAVPNSKSNSGEYMVKSSSDGIKLTINKTRSKDNLRKSNVSKVSSSRLESQSLQNPVLKPDVLSKPASKKLKQCKSNTNSGNSRSSSNSSKSSSNSSKSSSNSSKSSSNSSNSSSNTGRSVDGGGSVTRQLLKSSQSHPLKSTRFSSKSGNESANYRKNKSPMPKGVSDKSASGHLKRINPANRKNSADDGDRLKSEMPSNYPPLVGSSMKLLDTTFQIPKFSTRFGHLSESHNSKKNVDQPLETTHADACNNLENIMCSPYDKGNLGDVRLLNDLPKVSVSCESSKKFCEGGTDFSSSSVIDIQNDDISIEMMSDVNNKVNADSIDISQTLNSTSAKDSDCRNINIDYYNDSMTRGDTDNMSVTNAENRLSNPEFNLFDGETVDLTNSPEESGMPENEFGNTGPSPSSSRNPSQRCNQNSSSMPHDSSAISLPSPKSSSKKSPDSIIILSPDSSCSSDIYNSVNLSSYSDNRLTDDELMDEAIFGIGK